MEADPDLALTTDESIFLRDLMQGFKRSSIYSGYVATDRFNQMWSDYTNRLNPPEGSVDSRLREMERKIGVGVDPRIDMFTGQISDLAKLVEQQAETIAALNDRIDRLNPKFGKF